MHITARLDTSFDTATWDAARCRSWVCAVTRRRFPVGASPTRQPLQPEATGAAMEVTKWLKPQAATDMLDLKSPRHTSTLPNPDLSASAPMSPSASCGHDTASARGSNVPIPAVSRSSKRSYSITPSARTRKDSGTVSPSAFAVVRLTMRSNLLGCSTGRSAGFAPRKILST